MDVELVLKIRQTLYQPLLEFCRTVEFDINLMVVRETSNGQWVRINVNPDVPVVYFGDRFLKASRKKSDTTPVFTAPTKPLTFGLVFHADVWAKIQALEDMEVRDFFFCG